jgi:hypothetical protein
LKELERGDTIFSLSLESLILTVRLQEEEVSIPDGGKWNHKPHPVVMGLNTSLEGDHLLFVVHRTQIRQ